MITVSDPFSEIKSKLKNILITRCGVKMDELNQYCQFDVIPVEEKSISEKLGEAIKDEYQGEKLVQENPLTNANDQDLAKREAEEQ